MLAQVLGFYKYNPGGAEEDEENTIEESREMRNR